MNLQYSFNPAYNYPIATVAKKMEVSRKTVYNWIDKGYIQCAGKHITGCKVVAGTELITFINNINKEKENKDGNFTDTGIE